MAARNRCQRVLECLSGDRLAAGLPLYPPSDALIANNYPPLSFILAHWLTRVLSLDAIIIGRCLSLLGILITAAGCGLSTRIMGGGAAAVTLSVAWYVAVMSRHFDIFAGMNDPQIFAGSIMMAGMVCFIVAYRDRRSVIPAFALMVLAGFFKHNLFATPATAIVWLLIHDRRTAMRAMAASTALIAVGFVASTIAFGPDFLYQLSSPREIRLFRIVQRIGHMQWIAPAGVIVIIWIVQARNSWQAQFCGLFCLCGLQSPPPANRRGSRHELAVRACHGYSHRSRTCVGRHRLPSGNVTYGEDYYPGRRHLALASDFSLRTLSGPDEPDVPGQRAAQFDYRCEGDRRYQEKRRLGRMHHSDGLPAGRPAIRRRQVHHASENRRRPSIRRGIGCPYTAGWNFDCTNRSGCQYAPPQFRGQD